MLKRRRKRMKSWIPAALLLVLALIIAPNCSSDVNQNKADKKKATVPSAKKKVTFVELGSVKCIPCKMMQPVMKDIEKEYGSEVEVVFHDVWTAEGEPLGRQYRIMVIPTQVFLDEDGKEFFRHEGYFPKDEIVKVLKTRGIGK
jgi:thioredoxin 1